MCEPFPTDLFSDSDKGGITYMVVSLYGAIGQIVANFLGDETFMFKDIISDKRGHTRDVLIFVWGGVSIAWWMWDEIASIIYQETTAKTTILSQIRRDVIVRAERFSWQRFHSPRHSLSGCYVLIWSYSEVFSFLYINFDLALTVCVLYQIKQSYLAQRTGKLLWYKHVYVELTNYTLQLGVRARTAQSQYQRLDKGRALRGSWHSPDLLVTTDWYYIKHKSLEEGDRKVCTHHGRNRVIWCVEWCIPGKTDKTMSAYRRGWKTIFWAFTLSITLGQD